MQQEKRADSPEVISMEEYLTKRKKIKEKEQKQRKGEKKIIPANRMWMLAELYV